MQPTGFFRPWVANGSAVLFIAITSTLISLFGFNLACGEQPNIVFIFADDLGWRDVGFQGAKFIETPQLNKLAKQGVVFSSAYATAGNCAPSRACLLSGKYTPRHGVFAVGKTDRGPQSLQRLIPIPNRNGLASRFVTMAESLRGAGYVTGHFGKWHLAGPEGALPTKQGFDISFDSFGEGQQAEGSEGNKSGPPEDPKGVFTLTRKACEFMESNRNRPFFCYLAHHAIHSPLQGQPESLAKFKAKSKLDAKEPNAMYAACTAALDESVGMLVDKVNELGLERKTLIVFNSDNGAVNSSSQEPLRGSKGGYYEGGIRVPCFVVWPGRVEAGRTCDVPISNVDFYPTFLAAAGMTPPADLPLDGESLLPLLTNAMNGANESKGQAETESSNRAATLKRESIYWHFPGYLNTPVNRGRELDVRTGFRSRPVSVIRKGDWKLHLFHEEWVLDGGRDKIDTNQAIELYDLKADIGERTNLSSTNPQKRDELLDDLLAWIEATNAPLPSERNPKFDQQKFDSARPAMKNRNRGRKQER